MPASDIVIKGAREHNLRDVDARSAAQSAHLPDRRQRVAAKARWRSTRSMPKGSGGTSKACRASPGSFWGRCPSPTSITSAGLSPSISISQKSSGQQPALDRRHDHRDLRLSCACSSPASARGIARKCDRPITAQIARADHRPHRAAAGGDEVLRARAAHPPAKGRIQRPVRGPAEARLRAGPRRWRRSCSSPTTCRSTARCGTTSKSSIDRLVMQGRRSRRGWPKRSSWRCKLGKGNLIVALGSRRSRAQPVSALPVDEDERTRPSDEAEARRQRRARKSGAARRPRRATSSSPPTTPARTAASASSRRARSSSASTARRGCAWSATAWASCTRFDPELLVPDPTAVVQGGLHRADRPVERAGPLAAAHLSRRGRHDGAQARRSKPARCSKRRGRSSTGAAARSGCTAPATSTSRSPGEAGNRRRSTAASSKGIVPELLGKYRSTQEHACSCGSSKSTCASIRCPACHGAAAESASARGAADDGAAAVRRASRR